MGRMIQQAIGENAHFALDQGEYQERYNGLVDRFDLARPTILRLPKKSPSSKQGPVPLMTSSIPSANKIPHLPNSKKSCGAAL